MGNVKPFWMVYGIGAGAPTYQHETEQSAVNEAKRLARSAPGRTFVVLEAVGAITKREFDIVMLRRRDQTASAGAHRIGDDIPF